VGINLRPTNVLAKLTLLLGREVKKNHSRTARVYRGKQYLEKVQSEAPSGAVPLKGNSRLFLDTSGPLF